MFEGLRCIGLQWPGLAVAQLHSECTHPSACVGSCSALCRTKRESGHRLSSHVMISSSSKKYGYCSLPKLFGLEVLNCFSIRV